MEGRHLVVVLVEPLHEGNVGAVARAMGNLGIERLRLVRGPALAEESERMACGSRDVLAAAARFERLEDAVADASLAVGFASPERRRDLPVVALRDAIPRIREAAVAGGAVALVFGREDRGLTREEAAACGVLAFLPTPGPRPTLNVAQAVLLAGYELLRSEAPAPAPPRLPSPGADRPRDRPATGAEREAAYEALREALLLLGLEESPRPQLLERVLGRLRAICERAGLDLYDVQMLRGLAAQIERRLAGPPAGGAPRPSDRDLDWPEQL